jgi:hypothetical protein
VVKTFTLELTTEEMSMLATLLVEQQRRHENEAAYAAVYRTMYHEQKAIDATEQGRMCRDIRKKIARANVTVESK